MVGVLELADQFLNGKCEARKAVFIDGLFAWHFCFSAG
jgi:hypothetical protein